MQIFSLKLSLKNLYHFSAKGEKKTKQSILFKLNFLFFSLWLFLALFKLIACRAAKGRKVTGCCLLVLRKFLFFHSYFPPFTFGVSCESLSQLESSALFLFFFFSLSFSLHHHRHSPTALSCCCIDAIVAAGWLGWLGAVHHWPANWQFT